VLTLNQSACSELEKNQDKEWLITNGIGGYASSTVAGLNTRAISRPAGGGYHPSGRQTSNAAKIHDTLVVSGNTSEFALKSQIFE
jgi:hypothetical protein